MTTKDKDRATPDLVSPRILIKTTSKSNPVPLTKESIISMNQIIENIIIDETLIAWIKNGILYTITR